MQYLFYAPVISNEHMLLRKEIAELYGIKGSNPANAVSYIFTEYNNHTGIDIPEYYYNGSRGLYNVYPFEFYDKAIKWFYERVELNRELTYPYYNKTYKLKLTKILK